MSGDTLFDVATPVRRSLITEMARDLTGRPGAHLAVITWLTMDHDGFDGVKVELMDAPLCLTGKRKGLPNWRKGTDRRPLIVTRTEWEAARVRWEQTNDACAECVGTGEEWAGWSVDRGEWFVPCRKCGATGRPTA